MSGLVYMRITIMRIEVVMGDDVLRFVRPLKGFALGSMPWGQHSHPFGGGVAYVAHLNHSLWYAHGFSTGYPLMRCPGLNADGGQGWSRGTT